MKTALALLFIAAVSVQAMEIDLTAMLQVGTSSNDAVEAVYQLLNDLKQANLEAQHMADKKNITDEEIGAKVIGELTKVMDMNRATWQEAKDHRDWVDGEIKAAVDFINWAHGRIAEIERKSVDLEEMRCVSNGLFVRSIKQHQDALEVIRLLKQDLSGYLTQGNNVAMAEVKVENYADKLKMYSNLFNQKAMDSFSQLATDQASGGAELHAGRDDFVATGSQGGDEKQPGDNIGQQIYNLLCDLEAQLHTSLANLEENEIAAAYHLADWLDDSEDEKATLLQEIEKKTQYQEKLQLSAQAALASQAKANAVLKESQTALDQAMADLQERRDFWQEEFDRRNEENSIIDEVIHMFRQQVMDMAGSTSYGR